MPRGGWCDGYLLEGLDRDCAADHFTGFYRTVMNHGAPKSVYRKDLLREQSDEETRLQEEGFVPRGTSTAVALRNSSVITQPEPNAEADLESELRVIDAELVVGELKVKRLEAEESLAETKLRRVRLECRKDAMRKQRDL